MLGGLLLAGPAQADSVTLLAENDSFADTDHNYTSGMKLVSSFHGVDRLDRGDAEAVLLLLVGQSLFTPTDLSLAHPDPADRPYAAWLYGGAGLSWEEPDRFSYWELQLGVVGPSAKGEDVQVWSHSWSDSEYPAGWSQQLPDEPGLLLSHRRGRRLAKTSGTWGAELLPFFGGSLGNVYTNLSAGSLVRAGRGLEADLLPPRIRPSLIGSGGYSRMPPDVGGYVFVGGEGRLVARNIFLDGSTVKESRSVEKLPAVGSVEAGAALMLWGVRLSYTHVRRTREFVNQSKGDDFGSAAITVGW
jgi:lipid A 3-O-deacylase